MIVVVKTAKLIPSYLITIPLLLLMCSLLMSMWSCPNDEKKADV